MSKLYFRDNFTDFYIWCRKYVRRSIFYVRHFEGMDDPNWQSRNLDEYRNVLVITRQYEVLKASLPREAFVYLEKYLVRGEYLKWQRYDPWRKEIFNMWKEVCFPEAHPQIQPLDPVKVGTVLKRLRIDHGYTVTKIAELLHISPITLRSYESGRTLVRLDVVYGLAQIYETSIDEILIETNT